MIRGGPWMGHRKMARRQDERTWKKEGDAGDWTRKALRKGVRIGADPLFGKGECREIGEKETTETGGCGCYPAIGKERALRASSRKGKKVPHERKGGGEQGKVQCRGWAYVFE